jgi:hypothetical protein
VRFISEAKAKIYESVYGSSTSSRTLRNRHAIKIIVQVCMQMWRS